MADHPQDLNTGHTDKPKPSVLGSGAAAKAAQAAQARGQRVTSGADAALAAFRRAQGLPVGGGQSTDSNQ